VTSRDTWIEAGQHVLREDGFAGLKLAKLTARLGVTTGSFYHHFADFGTYLDALADAYDTRAAFGVIADEHDPLQRIRVLRATAEQLDIPRLDAAMRVWAASSDRARAAVAQLDAGFLEFLDRAFRDLGFDADDARVRAYLAFSASVAIVFSPWTQDGDLDRTLTVLASR
jgi:AcrR family transcriptional regulator